jgi:hypothetical protein
MPYEAVEYTEGESESEGEAEAAEARQPLRRPASTPSFKPRAAPTAAPNYVTQTQLEAALARSDGKIKTLAEGVSTLNARIGVLASRAKKEADQRKKSVDSQGRDINEKLQLLALLPLIISPPSIKGPQITIPATYNTGTATSFQLTDGLGNPVKHLSLPDRSTLDALLPLLLVTGVGTPGGLSLGGDGSDNTMMLLALALAIGNK